MCQCTGLREGRAVVEGMLASGSETTKPQQDRGSLLGDIMGTQHSLPLELLPSPRLTGVLSKGPVRP